MHILGIRLCNLNSLAGEWDIDLTRPEYGDSGIFAVTGPTGAGKSTLFDAVCLALYGATPRLGKISKTDNEIMSRHTGSCFAEVLFQADGVQYRCHWSQHRAGRKAGGALQAPRQELSAQTSGEIIASGPGKVPAVVEELTGLDFARFTRSILLAQGDFAAFLQAPAGEKAPILEQITGTDIYRRISQEAHTRYAALRQELDTRGEQLAGVALLSPDDVTGLRAALAEKEQQDQELTRQLDGARQEAVRLERIAGLERETEDLAGKRAAWESDMAAFAPEKIRLEQHERTVPLHADQALLLDVRNEQAGEERAGEELRRALPEREAAVEQAGRAETEAERLAIRRREELTALTALLREVRAKDQSLAALALRLRDVTDKADRAGKRRAALRAEAESAARIIARHEQEYAGLERFFTDQATGERHDLAWLRERAAAVKEHGSMLKAALETVEDCLARTGERDGQRKRLEQLNLERTALARAGEETRKKLAQAEEERALQEKRALLSREIQSLEEKRRQLAAGEPCPLCGSLNHPYIQELPRANDAERAWASATTAVAELAKENTRIMSRAAAAETEYKLGTASLAAAEECVSDLREKLETLAARIVKAPVPDAVATLRNALPSLREKNAAAVAALSDAVARAEHSERELARLRTEQAERMGQLRTLEPECAALDAERQSLLQDRERLKNERHALFADKKPDAEEAGANQAVGVAEKTLTSARAAREAAVLAGETLRPRLAALGTRLTERAARLSALTEAFRERLTRQGFADEDAVTAARLPEAHYAAVRTGLRDLELRETERAARVRQVAEQLAHERASAGTRDADACAAAVEALLAAQKTVLEERGGISQRLADDQAARERHGALLAELETLRGLVAEWSVLHALIGSHDGAKFRNFAQGLTLENVVIHANRELRAMNDRYLLARDRREPLELNVADSYQAGEIRPARTLSGGESFLVSLALALGLSRIAGQNVRVDSLFLDEGFGTLDEDALDAALAALAGLRRQGKLIGIISHVPALRERIGARIDVIPRAEGRSALAGPGCTERR